MAAHGLQKLSRRLGGYGIAGTGAAASCHSYCRRVIVEDEQITTASQRPATSGQLPTSSA
jgi:hypothetical protein